MQDILKIDPTTNTMDSRELAVLCGQEHFNCMKRIRKILSKNQAATLEYTFKNNDLDGNYVSTVKYYKLPEREARLLAMSYSYELMIKVYDAYAALKAENETLKAKSKLNVYDVLALSQEILKEKQPYGIGGIR